MKKLVIVAALSVFVFSAVLARAACTTEDVQKKAMQVSTQLQALAQKDSQRFQKLMQEYTDKAKQLQNAKDIKDLDDLCKYFDKMIEETK